MAKTRETFDEETGRKKVCEGSGKTMFEKRDAQSKRNFLIKLGRARDLRIYQCPDCNYFHLSSSL